MLKPSFLLQIPAYVPLFYLLDELTGGRLLVS